MTRFLGGIDTDLWVGQQGSKDLTHSLSILPTELESKLANIEGVKSVVPFVSRQVSFEIDGKEAHLNFIGDDGSGTVKPYKLTQGTANLSSQEIVVDETFAQDKKVVIGDTLKIDDINFKIVGLAKGGNMIVYTFALMRLDDLRAILDFSNNNNYYLVKSDQPELAEKNISSEINSVLVMGRQEFLDNNAAIVRDSFLPIAGVLLIIAIAIGVAVIGLTIFTSTIEKSREYGVLKAIGYTSSGLYGIALIQSLVSGVIGFVIGYFLSLVVVEVAQRAASGFVHEVTTINVMWVLVLTIFMSILASFIPLQRLSTIDPAKIFKA